MNAMIDRWFRRCDINPDYFPGLKGSERDTELMRMMWRVAYRDARIVAAICHHDNKDLVTMRGFGVMKRVWAKSGNCIGRVRVNNLANFDNRVIANQLPFQDYNPNRDLPLTVK